MVVTVSRGAQLERESVADSSESDVFILRFSFHPCQEVEEEEQKRAPFLFS